MTCYAIMMGLFISVVVQTMRFNFIKKQKKIVSYSGSAGVVAEIKKKKRVMAAQSFLTSPFYSMKNAHIKPVVS